jgi:hypothetical protein
MQLNEGQNRKVLPVGWSPEEELVIATIQQTESVPRAEAIRRMRRRKKASNLALDRAWYAARLDDPWLLDFSIVVRRSDRHFLLAAPIGGRRRGGFVSLKSPKDADQAADRLRGTAGFPNVRIERSQERGAYHVVRWGENEPSITQRCDQADAQIAQHRAAGEFFGYSDSAIRAFLLDQFGRETVLATERLCRNPRCARGEDHGAGSLAHLRADALYCNAACKKAAQRSPRHENRASNRQCLRGAKGDKSGSLLLLPCQPDRGAQIACNRNLKSIRQTETVGSTETGIAGHGKRMSRSRFSLK